MKGWRKGITGNGPKTGVRDTDPRYWDALSKRPPIASEDGRPATDDHPDTKTLESKLDFRRHNLRVT